VIQTDVRLVKYDDFGLGVQFVTGGPRVSHFHLAGSTMPIMIHAICSLKPSGLFGNSNHRGLSLKMSGG
jgi:hypothetical protein